MVLPHAGPVRHVPRPAQRVVGWDSAVALVVDAHCGAEGAQDTLVRRSAWSTVNVTNTVFFLFLVNAP